MTDDLHQEKTRTVDWKVVVAAMALTWTVAIALAGFFRSSVIDAMDLRIADHDRAAAESRRQFFDTLEQRADGSLSRINQLEINCARFQDWRTSIDRELDSIRIWRDATSQRLESLAYYIKTDDKRMDAIDGKIEEIKDRLRGGQPSAGQ